MKILTTVSCRSGANIFIELFHLRGLLVVYDVWARLKTAGTGQWGLSFTYDRFGHRTQQNVTAGSGVPANSLTISSTTNRVTGASYDSAGNMTNDGTNTLVYDAENRSTSATNGSASGTYSYDGNGLRVKKVSGATTTVYIFSGSKVVAEYDNGAAVASPSREYIYAGAQLVATLSGGATTYHHADHLSTRVSTDSTGTVTRAYGHYPFGETWYETGTASKLKFTSYERDSESANDYAIMRSHVNRLGRFSSPDPLSGHLGNPQSLNRYAHTLSDPINLIDPFGAQAITTIGEPHPPRGPLTGGGSGGTPDKLILGLGPEASGAGCPLCVPPPQPPPPPGYEECKAALAVAHKDFDAVERAEGAADVIRGAASANGVDPNLLAAVGVRESGWSNILEHGGGQGAGIFQIDLGAHPDAAAFARIPGQAA